MEPITCWPPPDESNDCPVEDSQQLALEPLEKKARTFSYQRPKKREPECLATVTLAKWWKSCVRTKQIQTALTSSKNPNTRLAHICRHPDAKKYLTGEIQRLRHLLSRYNDRDNIDIHAALASSHELLRETEVALIHAEKLMEVTSPDVEHILMHERLKRQERTQRHQAKRKMIININSMKPTKPVVVREAKHFSYQDFFFNFALTSTPVVITGLENSLTSTPWDFQHIKDIAGHCLFTSKRHVNQSVEWAKLEDDSVLRVSDFIDSLPDQNSLHLSEQRYLFDWSLPIHCPILAQEVTIPKYFANDFLQRTQPGSLYKDSWPSLFISPKGIRSELHVDTFGSNFWMALFQGKKRWLFFSKEDAPLLYPSYCQSLDPVFDVDLDHPDFENYPLLSEVIPRECTLEPGQVLFVPAGCPHRVENLEQSLAISSNFVDLSNFELVKEELSINRLISDRAKDLYNQITSNTFPLKLCGSIDHTKYNDYSKFSTSNVLNY